MGMARASCVARMTKYTEVLEGHGCRIEMQRKLKKGDTAVFAFLGVESATQRLDVLAAFDAIARANGYTKSKKKSTTKER